MNIILDTHSFLWFVDGNAKLSTEARAVIEAPEHTRFVSIASMWEMAIKYSMNRLQLALPFHLFIAHQLTENDMTVLNITLDHTAMVAELPFHHKDPFDRLIIAQALVEQLPIVSVDEQFDAYGVARIW